MNKNVVILLLIVIFLSSGCGLGKVKPQVGPPWMQKLITQGPPGPTKYQKGWRDGCETGISATANTFIRAFYRFRQDSTLARDPVYYTGWNHAFDYCQRYVFQYLRRNII